MTKLEIIYRHFCTNYRLTIDSRKVVPGSIYLALKGERFDGNQFAQQALESGASLVVVDNDKYNIEDERVMLVEDSLKTLQSLATHHRKSLNIPVIALTGSNGKTT
ncbi:MAG TPA: UDP-N-acetylmuramoyl-tripeptide--D-alanyl-D-alanine ligase, partial [Saprospirales bacterium]|nr:UDP-N-acetylmuramoyl-tripeptide--D-alanyl-D-alanine ligase [Saprospirales bacterium]